MIFLDIYGGCKMKNKARIKIFLRLKLMEILVFFKWTVFIAIGAVTTYFIGRQIRIYILKDIIDYGNLEIVQSLMIGILTLICIAIVILLMYLWIKSNWKKAGEIEKKLKRRSK